MKRKTTNKISETDFSPLQSERMTGASHDTLEIYLKQIMQELTTQKSFQKKRLRHARIRTLIAASSFVLFFTALFAFAPALNRIFMNIEIVSKELSKVEFVEMTESVTTVAVEGTRSMDEAMEDLDMALTSMDEALRTVTMIDVEKLNKSIEDLSTLMSPLAALFGG